MPILVRSTCNCANTPRVLFALEELELAYDVEVVEDGTFSRDWGSPGPTLADDDIVTIEPAAVLRHLARRTGKLLPATLAQHAALDRWIDFLHRRVGRALEDKDLPEAMRLLGFLERHVATHTWLVGDDFTIGDIAYALLATSRARLPLAQLPALAAYADRLAARPAYERALTRSPRS